jgi:hypothetical protein
MNPSAQYLRQLARDTAYRHGATGGYVCVPRVKMLTDALDGAACVMESQRRNRHATLAIAGLCAILATLTGAGAMALLLVP